MQNRHRSIGCVAWLLGLTTLIGCGHTPTQATSLPPADRTEPASSTLSGALSIPAFSITGWYADSTFHYVPRLTLAASADGALTVQVVNFKAHETDFSNLAGIRYVSPPRRIPPGGTLDLMNDPRWDSSPDMTSAIALPTITAIVTVNNDAGQTETVTAVAQVPAISQETAAAALVIQAFTVTGWKTEDGTFHYWPKLILAETSGVSRASLKKITFELLDVGAAGRVPPGWDAGQVPAGGTLSLDDDGYGPWFGISGKADASRVSVVIMFVDDTGRAGTVTAVAQVAQ